MTAPLSTVDIAAGLAELAIGLHREGPLPTEGLDRFDLLLTSRDAPRPWVTVADLDAAEAELRATIAANPVAASVLVQVLRASLSLSFEQALVQESLAYSVLLAGSEFRAWRAATPVRERADGGPRVRLEREGEALAVRLARPAARNAVDAAMRDELVEALEFALADLGPVMLSGEGPCFCAGGDLDEFGQASDVALAHTIRMARSPARLAHVLGGRLTARLHGACIGAGIEVPAAAGRVVAAPDAWFRLPEVGMGLIPGAGGTVTIPRRIGWRRTLYFALSGKALDAETALAWGLVDALEPAS